METITLTGRNSKLSQIQIELVKAQIEQAFPNLHVNVKFCSSLGDRLQNVALQTVEGSDFFTEEVFQNLTTGEADIAVHSLKDMSAEHFFGGNTFAVVNRDDVRDVAIFNDTLIEKLSAAQPIQIGTCSPRRELMATEFLMKALPQLHTSIKIETKIIRGNVDTRLRKLDAREYDGIILAVAGLNRLLQSDEHAPAIQKLLNDKKLMVLPLFECTPAPCQGAIVAEALSTNTKAKAILDTINQSDLFQQCKQEKEIALQYGAGCDQKFGVTTILYANKKSVFAAGVDGHNNAFQEWFDLPPLGNEKVWMSPKTSGDTVVTSTANSIEKEIVFVSNANAVGEDMVPAMKTKRVWAAGSKTWFKLAQKGIFVEGCADGLGLESMEQTWKRPLYHTEKKQVSVLTHTEASKRWESKGWNAIATYDIQDHEVNSKGIESAEIVFWSSMKYFQQFKNKAKTNAVHVCASGETANQLRQSGINPVVFPTIQSFHQWKKVTIPSRSGD